MVEGASIVNQKTFGTAGGGAPTLDLASDAPKVLDGSRSIEQVEARMELEAQAKGQSVWGRAGAGAPIRHEDGSINPHVRGRAEHDKDEVNDFRQNAAFKQRILVLAEQQGQALRDSEVRKKQDIAAEKKLDSTRLMSLKLQDDAEKFKTNMSAYTGERRFVKEGNMKDLQPKLFYTPLVKKDIAGLQLQIEAKKESQKREQALKLKEEAIHNSVADFAEVNTQRTAARMRDPKRHRDPILHVEEDAAKGMSNSTPAEKEALANALGNRIKERAALKKANRQKRRQDELAHSKASNKIFGPQSDHGFNETRQHDPLDYEYKMLVQKSSNLV